MYTDVGTRGITPDLRSPKNGRLKTKKSKGGCLDTAAKGYL